MFQEAFTTVKVVSKTANENCKFEENAAKDLHHCMFLSGENSVSRIIKNTNLHAALKSPKRSMTKDLCATKRTSSDFSNRLNGQEFNTNSREKNGEATTLNERKCPDCGRKWNPIIQQIEFLCLSPPPLMLEHQSSPIYYREPTPSPYFNNSTSDYECNLDLGSSDDSHGFAELSSELDRSCDSLPPINWSITDL